MKNVWKMEFRLCGNCKKEIEIAPSKLKRNKNFFCDLKCCREGRVYKKGMINENHPAWRGESAGLDAKHLWVRRVFGVENKCEECGTTRTNTIYDWANLDHKYRRVREDWKRLCRGCHMRHDIKFNGRNNKPKSKNSHEYIRQALMHGKGVDKIKK